MILVLLGVLEAAGGKLTCLSGSLRVMLGDVEGAADLPARPGESCNFGTVIVLQNAY